MSVHIWEINISCVIITAAVVFNYAEAIEFGLDNKIWSMIDDLILGCIAIRYMKILVRTDMKEGVNNIKEVRDKKGDERI